MGAGQRLAGPTAGPLALLLSIGMAPAAGAAPPRASARPAAQVATYSIEALTTSGMGAMAMNGAALMQLMMGGRPPQSSSQRQLELRLRSPQTVAAPTAEHLIPAALAMGPSLPLKSTGGGSAPASPRRIEALPEAKGRLLIFRGCAESAGAGQPEIIQLQGLRPDQRQQALLGLRSLDALPGAAGSGGTSGRWPDSDDAAAVPRQASLVGSHRVRSNYAPEIRFEVGASHDFLAPVQLSAAAAGGAQRLGWQPVPTALGYQATATGAGRQEGDVVLWTSSTAGWADSSVPGDLGAPEAAQLVQRGVLLAPERTSCAVSAEAMAAMRAAVVSFTAFGDTLRLSSAKGDPAWRLRLERRSTASRLLGADLEGMGPGAGEGRQEPRREGGGFSPFRFF